MSLAPGARLGPYEVLAPVGAGGMGEVYRARDTKLHRDVALKVLPDLFAGDPDRLARFRREAQVLASLSHPNIAGIYGFEEAGGGGALVLELVEGPTLADRLTHGAIPVDEALLIARQIADALDAAHEQGIVHRDLKPSNVILQGSWDPTPTSARPNSRELAPRAGRGRSPDDIVVKVLDFGLAKMRDAPFAVADLSRSPTMMASMPGAIVGTAAYMAPEQAKGRETDRTADVWAFGCVLFEMLTGRPAYEGETVSEILANVLKSDPDWHRLPAETPEGIRRLLRRCLQKDRKQRLQHIGDARIEIQEVQSGTQTADGVASGPTRPRERAVLVSALVFAAVAAAVALAWALRPAPPAPEMRVDITTPTTTDPVSLAISPDGRKIAFEATSEGRSRLWLRSLDTAPARPLSGSDDGRLPFWSPDSHAVGFFADGKLKRVDIDGGSVQTLANAPSARGGTWSADGVILFSPTNGGTIFRVSATGGEPVGVTRREQPGNHRFPQFLPDGRHFIYYVSGIPERGVYLSQLDGSETRRLLDSDVAAVFSSSGYLLVVRQGTLFAHSFDPVRLALTGNPFPVAEQVAAAGALNVAAVSASASGALVYRTGSAGALRQFAWFDRSGKEIGKIGNPDSGGPLNPSLSPDGRRVALYRTANANVDIWLLDTGRAVLSRFTSDPANDINAIWSPDGSRIVFQSNRKRVSDLYQKSADGAGSEELLLATPQDKAPSDWSPDGRFLLYRNTDPKLSYDIWALPLEGDRKPFPVVQTEFEERDGQFSPDGKWIAYQSNESGRSEVYVQPFPGPGGKSQVSTNGGAQVRWRRDGRELFYVALDARLMAAPIRLAPDGQAVEAGAPVPLFVTHIGGAVQGINRQQYMVSPDGQRFLMNTIAEDANPSPITLILNWKPKS